MGRLMPAVFVLIWSTGFVVARLAMPHAPPLAFLEWRYGLSALCFGLWALLAGAAWPRGRAQWLHVAVTGTLVQAGYLGGVWVAVKAGLSAGGSALVVSLQPVLTAVFLQLSSGQGRLVPRQWWGLALGLAGVLLVVWNKLWQGEVTALNLAAIVAALFSITAGTLYQKRFVGTVDVRSAGVVQMAAAAVVSAPLWWWEAAPMVWSADVVVAMAWSVLALTLGASSLLYLMVQRGAAMQVTSLFYLVPPCTAAMAWLLFQEPLSLHFVLGLVLTALGVALVQRGGAVPSSSSKESP